MKRASRPARKRTPKKRPMLPKIWNGLVYADLLSKFTREIEKLAHTNVRTKEELANDRSKKSQMKLAFDSGRKLIRDLDIDQPDIRSAVSKIEGAAKSFESAHKSNIEQLEKLLPKAADGSQMSWPPPIPAHLTINSFVSLSLRIHTERPHLRAEKVMMEAARTTILPVLAHWLCISGRSGMLNEGALKALDESFNGKSTEHALSTDDAWIRVAKVLAKAAKETFGAEASALLEETKQLIEDYRGNPHGGRLWQQMGKLNGTPPGSNLLTVFECIHRLEPGEEGSKSVESGASTYYCSRLRYEAVRLGHYDEEFKRLAAGDIGKIKARIDGMEKANPDAKLSMAFTLSRQALISAGEPHADERKAGIAKLTCDILKSVSDDPNASNKTKEVADRYLLGFMTNPRFMKPFKNMDDLRDRLGTYQARHSKDLDSVPGLLSGVFKARILWAKALGGENIPDNQVIGLYAHACERLLASIESGARGVAFDSEAPIWILPEMSALVWMGDKYSDRPEVMRRIGQDTVRTHNDSERKKLERFANASSILSRIAETEFGIYYHQVHERRRILEGMVKFSEIAQASRQSKNAPNSFTP